MPSIGIIVIVIVVIILLFFLLREVNCWYWKINERISLMKEQNDLLRNLLSGSNSQEKVETGIVSENATEKNARKYDKNTITIRHKLTKNVETVDLAYWEKMKKMYGEDKYEIIEYH